MNKRLGYLASFLVVSFFIGIFLVIAPNVLAAEVIYHNGSTVISTSTVWRAGEIHVIADGGSLTINSMVTLTLEAGTIVKVGYNVPINVYGNLTSAGTESDLVYIVSLKDDSIGGDTNGDGTATVAGIGDWRGISANGSRYSKPINLTFDYTVLRSGGGTQAGGGNVNRGALILAMGINDLKISHCDFSDNKGALLLFSFSGVATINNSNLYSPSFCDYTTATSGCQYDNGVTIYTDRPTDLTNNYWGSSAGPTYTTGTEPTAFNGVVLGNIGGGSASYLPFATAPFEFGKQRIDPVILIPGVLGSWNVSGKLELDPILHTYDNLWEAFKASGYVEGEDLFAFPYEWRDSNLLNALKLRDKIAEVKAQCGCDKVDIVAHSMGGILARAYVQGPNFNDDVDQLVFLATPQRGATASYLTWEGGENGTKNTDKLMKLVFEQEAKINGFKSLYEYIQNRPIFSARELLPIFDYLKDKATGLLRSYPDNYPTNGLLETLNNPISLARLAKVKLYNFVGDNGLNNTIDYLRVVDVDGGNNWPNGYPEGFDAKTGDHGLEYGVGDQTVPARSNQNFMGLPDIKLNSDHGNIVTDAQKQVIKILRGKEPTEEVRKNVIEKLLLVRIFSPADFQVVAPDGQIVGSDLNGSTSITQIANAYYSGSDGGPEFVTIPNPQEGRYQIKLIGTDNGGEYTISNTIIDSDGQTKQTDYTGQILPEQNQLLDFDYSNDLPLTAIKADITIESAIKMIGILYSRQLIIGNSNKTKIIQQYELLKLKVSLADKLISLAVAGINKLDKNQQLRSDIKAKLISLANQELNKLRLARDKEISASLIDLDNKYLKKYLTSASLKQLGYDIIKSNNDYLINNW